MNLIYTQVDYLETSHILSILLIALSTPNHVCMSNCEQWDNFCDTLQLMCCCGIIKVPINLHLNHLLFLLNSSWFIFSTTLVRRINITSIKCTIIFLDYELESSGWNPFFSWFWTLSNLWFSWNSMDLFFYFHLQYRHFTFKRFLLIFWKLLEFNILNHKHL